MLGRVRQLLRFSAVGLLCFGVATGVLAGLCEIGGMNYLPAYVCSFVVSNIVGYLLNGRYTFGRKGTLDYTGASRYMAVNVSLLIESSLLLKWLVDGMHVWYLGASFVLAAVNTPISFVAHQLVTYRLRRVDRLDHPDPPALVCPNSPSSCSSAAAYPGAPARTSGQDDSRRTS